MMVKPLPFFSVIIPTYNRPESLSVCLESIVCLNYPRDLFEVLVVDDGSEISAEGIVDSMRDRLDARLLRQLNNGPAAARNNGAAAARGAFLAFTDDDCQPAPDWLASLAARLNTAPGCMVGGRTVNLLEESIYAVATQLVVDLVYDFYNADGTDARFFASNNMALPAEMFRALGGFDPAFRTAEDRDLCDRWLCKGYGMVYAPEAVVKHSQILSLRRYWRLYVAYGRGAFRFNRAHALRNRPDSTLRLDFHIYYLRRLGGALTGMPLQRKTALLVLLLIWQAANLLGFACEAMRHLCSKFSRFRNDTGDEKIRTHT
jgi:glycosyltransferase involved in cell wall biosynthesis